MVNVDHPTPALALRALHGRRVRALARDGGRHLLGQPRDLLVTVNRLDRHVDVKPSRAGGLRVGFEAEPREHVARCQSDLADGLEPDALARIEVEDEPVGVIQVLDARVPRVALDGSEVRHVKERRLATADDVINLVAAAVLDFERDGADEVGHFVHVVLVERLPAYP